MPTSTASIPRLLGLRFDWRRWSERAFLAILILVFIVTGFIPAWTHLNSDFPNYYLIARLYREGYPLERVYEWTWLQRQKDHRGIDQPLVSFIPSTLPSALMVLPWSALSPLQAKHWWLLVNLAFLSAIAVLLAAITNLVPRRVALLMFLAVIPLRNSFLLGQMHIFVLLLLTYAAWLYFKDSFFFSGMVLAIAATMKIYPALFLIFFAFKKQWRAAVGLVVGLSSAAMVSLYIFGRDACLLYAQEVLPRGLRGETIDPYNIAWNSLSALLRRLLIAEPELNPAPVAHLPWLYAFLYSLIATFIFIVFMWAISFKTHDRDRQKLEWASYLFLLLLLSSQPSSYHFVSLILPAVLVTDYLVQRGQQFKASALVCVYVLALGSYHRLYQTDPTGWQTLLCFPRLFFLVLFGGLMLWVLISSSEESAGHRLRSRASLFAAIAFVVLFVVNFTNTLRHFKGQFDNYASRLITVSGSGIAADPVVVSDDLFFTALVPRFLPSVPDTYAVHDLSSGSVKSFAVGGDWFHPAAGRDSKIAWAEVATSGGSRVVRFFPTVPLNSEADTIVEAEDAEQPVVSSDGELLAFIREVKGRDSLWIRQIAAHIEANRIGEHQIAGSQYDVREAAFYPDHRMVFSSKRGGRFRLYEANPVSGAIEEMSVPTCSARYPAISPDGKWLAFSCEHGGTWQVHTMNLHTSEQLQITNADCNSISPAWTADSKDLVYATDCGRGLGLTALARLSMFR